MTAQIIKFPKQYRDPNPRYKVAWSVGAQTGFVADKLSGSDWESREEWEAAYVAFVMDEQYRESHVMFWVHVCGEYE